MRRLAPLPRNAGGAGGGGDARVLRATMPAMRTMIALSLLFLACERERPDPILPFDAGPRRDAGRFDAGPFVRRDAGPLGPTIDGVDGVGEWAGAIEVESDVETD